MNDLTLQAISYLIIVWNDILTINAYNDHYVFIPYLISTDYNYQYKPTTGVASSLLKQFYSKVTNDPCLLGFTTSQHAQIYKVVDSGGSVVKAFAPWAGGCGFDPRPPRHTKDVIKMVPDASLLSAQHIRTGLASLSSQTSFKKRWIPSGMSGRKWLI